MTSATATTAILVLFDGAIFSANVLIYTFELSRMTGGAIRRILGSGPGKCTVHTATMATVTPGISSVIARIIAIKIMAEVGRCPAIRCMADIALYGCA